MGKFIDIIESRFRDYRDRDDEDVSYDFMNPLSKDRSQSDSTYPDPLGNHNNSQEKPSTSEDPVDIEPEEPAVDDTPEPTTTPTPVVSPEVESEPEEQSVEQLLSGIGGERGESITRINDYFNTL